MRAYNLPTVGDIVVSVLEWAEDTIDRWQQWRDTLVLRPYVSLFVRHILERMGDDNKWFITTMSGEKWELVAPDLTHPYFCGPGYSFNVVAIHQESGRKAWITVEG